jgi:hypothetical protein
MSDATELTEEITYCTVHPDRETSLRCNKCGRLMCAQCAVQTPVGYRCRECVRSQEDKFYSATNNDYYIVAAVVGGLAAVAGAIISAMGGFLIVGLILGFPVGGGISEAALRATQRRRGRQSAVVGAVAAVVGGLLGAFVQAATRYNANIAFRIVTSNIGVLLFVGLVAMAVYGRYKMRF